MQKEMVTITREEFVKLKRQANVDMDLLKHLLEGLRDIKEGRVRRVK